MASPPLIAAELRWAGFDMLAHANNHAFDYGTVGVLETIKHIESEGLIVAGSGTDLHNARAPRYFHCNESTVALVAMASDFVPYGKASHSRPDVPGRPGINPLAISRRQIKMTPLTAGNRLRKSVSRLFGLPRAMSKPSNFDIVVALDWRPDPSDLAANLDVISEAACKADVVVVSIHAHRQGPWLATFAHQAIDRGSHLVLIHGPHQIRGVELYKGHPIFYSLGDFVFESEYVTRLPAEAYQRVGLAPDAPIEALRASNDKHMSGLLQDRDAFRAIVALISIANGTLSRVRLLPIDLNFESKHGSRGRPQLASPEAGKRIILVVKMRSIRFGTRIHYDPVENLGEVVLS
jgi:poly-gamma-glutamate synthesis protein (capsule biosynthesis protein)